MSVRAGETASLPKPGDVIDAKYRVDHRIGSGAMSVVYQVTHHLTQKRFAMKWLLPELAAQSDLAERFLREARVGGRFEHPNVVEVYDVGASDGGYYMVLELLSGESLQQRIQRAGELSWPDVCRLLLPCMRAVAEAHSNGIVHRDLKPANIFVCVASRTAPERAKVLDFGLAKLARAPGEQSLLGTRSGVVMGTPHYMPLEQMRGEAVDRRVDVYAFGVTLYQALSGRLPYQAATFGDLVLAMASESPLPLERWAPGLLDGVAAAIGRALARLPAERYADLNAFLEALTPFVPPGLGEESQRRAAAALAAEPETSRAPKSSAAQRVQKLRLPRRPRHWVAAIALLGAALLAGVAVRRQSEVSTAPATTAPACTGTPPCTARARETAHVSTQPVGTPAAEPMLAEHPVSAGASDGPIRLGGTDGRVRARGSVRSAAREVIAGAAQAAEPQPSWKVRRQWRQARAYVATAPPPAPRDEEPAQHSVQSSQASAGDPNRLSPQRNATRPPHVSSTQSAPLPQRPIRLMPLNTDDF